MKLEQQVVSLDLAKRLKELNVPQESLFYWNKGIVCDSSFKIIPEACSAFTVAELGKMLPTKIIPNPVLGDKQKTYYIGLDFFLDQINDFYGVARVYRVSAGSIQFKEQSEADARAKMLIYLLENNLITL